MKGTEGESQNMNKEAKEEESKSGKIEVERKGETVIASRCVNPFSSDVFEEFSPMGEFEILGNSWGHFCGDSCDFSVRVPAGSLGVPVVTDVLVSPLSVGVLGADFPSDLECEIAEPQSFSVSKMRQASLMESQGSMSMEDLQEGLLPIARRKIQEVDCEVGQGWAAVYQAVANRMLDYLNNSEVLKVNTRDLVFHVLAPNEPNVNIEHIVMQARGEGHQRLFQAFFGKEQKRFSSPAWQDGRHRTEAEEPGTLPSG